MFFETNFNSFSYPNYKISSSSGGSPTNSDSSCFLEDTSLTPTQLLSLAIKKRRSLIEDKDRDFRRELLHTTVIQSLCRHLGEDRARLRKNKRRHQWRRAQKRRWHEEEVEVDNSDREVPDPNFSPSLNTPDENVFDSAVQSNGNNGGNSMETMPTGQQPGWNVPSGQELDIGGHGLNQISALVPKNGDNGGHRNGPTPCKQSRLMYQTEKEVAGFALFNHSKNCSNGKHGHGNDTLGHGVFKFKWPYRDGCDMDMVMTDDAHNNNNDL